MNHQHHGCCGTSKPASETRAVDPVCGMSIDPEKTKHHSEHDGVIWHFCAARCKERFDADPNAFVDKGQRRQAERKAAEKEKRDAEEKARKEAEADKKAKAEAEAKVKAEAETKVKAEAEKDKAAGNEEKEGNVLQRLKELGQLRDNGIISEEEFQDMKKKLISEF